jgi:thiamine biosynthesis lipoprotein
MFPTTLFLFLTLTVSAAERFEFEEVHMGVQVRVVLYAESSDVADAAAKDAFDQFRTLNRTMSDYDSESELSQLCTNHAGSGHFVSVSDDLFAVFKSAKHYSELSDGAFDITVGPMVRLWRRSRRQKELPKQSILDQAKELVGNPLWELDEKTQRVRLLRAGMKFDLGGIAKGYAIDRAFEAAQKRGISSVLIDAGGDLRAGAAPPGKRGWKISLNGNETVLLESASMATSGDRFQFVEIGGVRYSHIIDPKTGLGLTTPSTVHITAETATEADALASAVSVLGKEKGTKLIETLNSAKNSSCPKLPITLKFTELDIVPNKDSRE